MIAENIDKVTGRAVPTTAGVRRPPVRVRRDARRRCAARRPAGVWRVGRRPRDAVQRSQELEKLVAWLGETVRAADASAAAMARAERELYDAFIAAGAAEEEEARAAWSAAADRDCRRAQRERLPRRYVEPQRPVIHETAARRRAGDDGRRRVAPPRARRRRRFSSSSATRNRRRGAASARRRRRRWARTSIGWRRAAPSTTASISWAACDCPAAPKTPPEATGVLYGRRSALRRDAATHQLAVAHRRTRRLAVGAARRHRVSPVLALAARGPQALPSGDARRVAPAPRAAVGGGQPPLYSPEGQRCRPSTPSTMASPSASSQRPRRRRVEWVLDSLATRSTCRRARCTARTTMKAPCVAIAITSNFLDGAHAPQVDAEFCAHLGGRERGPPDLRAAGAAAALRRARAAGGARRAPIGSARAHFWSWLLGRAGGAYAAAWCEARRRTRQRAM